jgi:predicted nucleotidyltransferase
MNRQAILDRLNAEAPGLRRRFGVKTLGVFGSVARGDGGEGSDLDVLVTFEGPATFRQFMGLKLYLEDTFARPVDLATPNMLRPRIRPGIERDLIHVP